MKKALLGLLLLTFVSGLASAQLLRAPIKVSAGGDCKNPQVAVTPDGLVHMIWSENSSKIVYATYDGTRIARTYLKSATGTTAERPYIAATVTGKILAVWDESNACIFRELDPAVGTWSDPFTIAGADYGTESPCVAGDSQGNVYVAFNLFNDGDVMARCRINGVWTANKRLSAGSKRSKAVTIAVGVDDRVWLLFGEKQASGSYKMRYSKRTATTDWTASEFVNTTLGADQDRPNLQTDVTGHPWIIFGDVDEVALDFTQTIYIVDLNEAGNPGVKVIPKRLQHYAKFAIDGQGHRHIAVEVGPGEGGIGIDYQNNVTGVWRMERLPKSNGHPKYPGVATNRFNVAVVWDSHEDGTRKDVWLSTLKPVALLYPPTNLTAPFTVSGGAVTFTLGWTPDARNVGVTGYKIYQRKAGESGFTAIATLAANAVSYTYPAPAGGAFEVGIAAVKTISATDTAESQIAEFPTGSDSVAAPHDVTAEMILSGLRRTPQIVYRLSWQNAAATPAQLLKGVKVYRKNLDEEWELAATLEVGSATTALWSSGSTRKQELAISVFTIFGSESALVPIDF